MKTLSDLHLLDRSDKFDWHQQALRSMQAGIAFRGIGRSSHFAHNGMRPLIDDGPARAG